MAFFSKLKDRLFKSQAKLDQGLDDLVREGANAEEAPTAAASPESRPETAPETTPAAESVVPATSPVEDQPVPDEPTEVRAPTPISPEPEPVPVSQSEAPAPAAPSTRVEPARTESGDPVEEREDPGPASLPQAEALERAVIDVAGEESAAAPKQGFFARTFSRQAAAPTRVLDDAMLESLEDVLIQADMGVETAMELSARLSERHYGRRVDTATLKQLLSDEIEAVLEPVAVPLPLYAKRPQVVLVVGVNGAGKTTTIGKLSSQLNAAGKRVVIAAGDTFRAAAVEQLQVWGERAGVPVMTAAQGSDPASLAYDALVRAEADGADLLLIDTAGRLQNRQDLMEELAKIVRVLRKKDADAPHNTVLVLDATVGQNALSQVETFQKIADVSGLVMTKLDGSAKGGVLVALAARFGLPIHAIGVGEQIDDLQPFEAADFATAITGAPETA
ncbi:MAG: signal recognition particle-docking protein FtsY [Pseudomonadota bacterium]